MADEAVPDNGPWREVAPALPPRGQTVFGRQGSPTITLALPFSRVDVKADDAAPLVAELAALTARLARAVGRAGLSETAAAELTAIAQAADALARAAETPGH